MLKVNEKFKITVDVKIINFMSIFFILLFALLLFLVGVLYYFKHKTHDLSEILVKGTFIHYNGSTIKSNVEKLNGNFFNVNLFEVKNYFEATPWVSQAIVKRVYPNKIDVQLSEYKLKAIWGLREDLRLIDESGVIFEANIDEGLYDQLPQFIGLDSQAKSMLNMYKELSGILVVLNTKLKILELNSRGSWIVTMENGARAELGRGSNLDIIDRVKVLTKNVNKTLIGLNKKISDIEYIDLRHSDGYAIRVQGVTTLDTAITSITTKK